MSKDNREDIFPSQLNYIDIALISNKVKVLIIGGGKAGFIKCKTFVKKGCSVWIVSEVFDEKFDEIRENKNLVMIKGSYNKELILDKHLIIIAVSDDLLRASIIEECEKNSKIYLNCTDFSKGIFITPMQRETENVFFSVHTKRGNPKASVYLCNLLEAEVQKNDEFIGYLCELRQKYKMSTNKNDIMGFVTSEDFKFFFNKGYAEEVLKMFYGG